MIRCMELSGFVLGLALFFPAVALPAVKTQSCEAGTPTAQSYTWNFPIEARNLLDQVGLDAQLARGHADTLEGLMEDPNTDWRVQADQLRPIRAEVNDMGAKLCRLETIRRVSSPWERQAIQRAAPLITELVNHTESAIEFMNGHKDALFLPAYQTLGVDLYDETTNLARSMREFENYDRAHQEENQLGKTLGLIKHS